MTFDPAPPSAQPSPRRGSSVVIVLAAAILSGSLASAGTAVILLATAPTGPAASSTAATAVPAAARTPAAATVSLDVGDAIANAAAAVEPSVVTISGGDRPAFGGGASGSGIVVSEDGLILTTTVVVTSETTYTVLFSDQREATARVVAADAAHGLVLLRADRTGLTPARVPASADLAVGQLVVAVGSPLGEFTDTVTAGIVSGLGRSIDLRDPATGQRVALGDLIQTDAAVNAGSSGGPLLDVGGTVVGIIATSASDGEGIGFAIPVEFASALLAQAAAQ